VLGRTQHRLTASRDGRCATSSTTEARIWSNPTRTEAELVPTD